LTLQAGAPDRAPYSSVRDAITGWWPTVRAERDELPWRKTRDPWAVLVAETMLSQTQVARVAVRYPDFVARFPTPAALAGSEPAEIIRLWSGLGYNRRGLNLRATAVELVALYGGHLPCALDALLALPGVGPYTARAVLAFAFGRPVGPVDTNIARVFARAVAGEPLTRARLQALADMFADGTDGREWNLALMDFGSAVCQARAPKCSVCPLRASCRWRRAGPGTSDPARGSAATSRPQARFVGSDREGRGRLVRALCEGSIAVEQIGTVSGWPDDAVRAERVASALVREGLAVCDGVFYRLP
jgi:A/G-specific adenine glycosylase